ncbi:MAG: substrate-binding domain-containing protein [Verrucomicrobia bacterium]|nr:substrate-binding domain-containing protein [Verrucomicrobiota bacterium]
MPLSSPLLDLPKRSLLFSEAAAALRRGLERGVWRHHLPSERRLAELLHVSRPTVRRALAIVAAEGLVALDGRRRLLTGERPVRRSLRGRRILIVTHQPSTEWPMATYQGIAEMQTYLARHGFECEIVACAGRRLSVELPRLAERIHRHGVSCALLVTVPRAVQEWFAQQPLPTLVVGSNHAAVALPSFDVDYFSVSRHAVGVLARQGHRRIALLQPATDYAGDLATEAGFLAATSPARPDGPAGFLARHKGDPRSIEQQIGALLRSAHPPTALIVSRPTHCLTALVYLLRNGIAVPEQMSLISRDQDPLLRQVIPAVAYYAFDNDAETRRMARLILNLVDHQRLPMVANRILPQFVAGGSIGPPPKPVA